MEKSIASAISRGLFRQVRYLIEFGRNVNRRGEDGRTPVMLCVFVESETWSIGLMRLLIEKGADLTKKDRNGLTALHLACMYGKEKLVKILLEAADFDLNAADIHGNTALHYAVAMGYEGIAFHLVKALQFYKRTLDISNKWGVTALIQAWKSGQRKCAEILLQAGANEDFRDMVYFKTASEWEKMCPSKTGSLESLNSSGSWNRRNEHRRIRSAKRENRQININSDRLVSKRRPKTAIGMSSDGDMCLILEETIQDAGPNAIRNNVRRIFDTDAVSMFDINRNTENCAGSQDSGRSDMSRSSTDSGSRAFTWRVSMGKLYSALEYQCAPSFRKPAKPDPNIRPGSPQQSEMSEVVSDGPKKGPRRSGRQSVAERRRLTSASSNSSSTRQRKVSSTHLTLPS